MLIFDVDNCIAHDAWRLHLIDEDEPCPDKKHHAYHLHSAWDKPGNLHLLAGVPKEDIFLCTAMPEHYRPLREMWLLANGIRYNQMLMRAPGDHRSSVEIKRDMLEELRRAFPERRVMAGYDDRMDVVQMYANNGVVGVLTFLAPPI